MMRPLALLLALTLALLATGCDGSRQVNPGAAVPVSLVSPQEMYAIVRERRPDIAHPAWVEGLHHSCGILLRSDLPAMQMMATMLHESVHRIADIDAKALPAAVEMLRQLDGAGFRTYWDQHKPEEW